MVEEEQLKPKIPAEEPETLLDDKGSIEASAEATAFASGNLEEVAERAQHGRRERTRDHIGNAAVIGVWVAAIVLIIGVLTWAFHLFAPEGWRYLPVAEITKIQDLLSHIIIGAVLGFLIKNKFM